MAAQLRPTSCTHVTLQRHPRSAIPPASTNATSAHETVRTASHDSLLLPNQILKPLAAGNASVEQITLRQRRKNDVPAILRSRDHHGRNNTGSTGSRAAKFGLLVRRCKFGDVPERFVEL